MWIVLPSVSLGLSLPGAKLPTPPVVILPGFGNAGLDYVTPLGADESVGLKAALERRGFDTVEVVPVDRTDWLRVAGGLLDADFRAGEGTPDGRAFGWYLERTGETVRKAKAKAAAAGDADARVLLLGHSAGGWLARAALGDGTPESSLARLNAAEDICGLVTLGSPHLPPPEGPPRRDETKMNASSRDHSEPEPESPCEPASPSLSPSPSLSLCLTR